MCNSTYCDTVDSVDDSIDKANFYQEYITSRSLYRLDKFVQKLSTEGSASASVNFTLNRSKSYQSIFGFGGAMTDATVILNVENIFNL